MKVITATSSFSMVTPAGGAAPSKFGKKAAPSSVAGRAQRNLSLACGDDAGRDDLFRSRG